MEKYKALFKTFAEKTLSDLHADEHLTVLFFAEKSNFTRFNHAKVRQSTDVDQFSVRLCLQSDGRTVHHSLPFSDETSDNLRNAKTILTDMRGFARQVAPDPYLVKPAFHPASETCIGGDLPDAESLNADILSTASGIDFTGLLTVGPLARGFYSSAGTFHWFQTNSFILDYSLIDTTGGSDRMVKGLYSGNNWSHGQFKETLQSELKQLTALGKPARKISRGEYRTYLAPAALAAIVDLLSWSAVSEGALQRKTSPLYKLRQNENRLSEKFSLRENFSLGLNTLFNEEGEVMADRLDLIAKGKLQQTLCHTRTAKEYGLTSNGASASESLRSPEVLPGHLAKSAILPTLDQGLLLSNIHYLNWSDAPNARLTGTTRYACLWVEDGEPIAPIETLRFDDSLFRILGSELADLTDFQQTLMESQNYDHRQLGGVKAPGALIEKMRFTL